MIDKELLDRFIREELEVALLEESIASQIRNTALAGLLGGAAVTAGSQFLDKERPAVTKVEPQRKLVKKAPIDKPNKAVAKKLDLPKGYEGLERLGYQLVQLDRNFNTTTPKGRAAIALALAIGGTEVFGRGHKGTNYFTVAGGKSLDGKSGTMKGFAQFNTKFHAKKLKTPAGYANFLADILTGKERMPNGRKKFDAASALLRDIDKLQNDRDLATWMQSQGFGGSNWQGIDDGWSRVPGLGESLIDFIKSDTEGQ